MNALERTQQFQRDDIGEKLSLCTKKQQDLFKRIYPKGIPDDSLISAANLIDRTLAKNQNGRE